MRKLVTSVEVVAEEEQDTKNFFLDYYILKKDVKIEGITASRYGLEIYKRAHRPDGTPYVEYRKIFDVFETEGEAEEVLFLMSRNTVTPIAMKDILEDVLGVNDFAGEVLLVEAM